MAVIFVSHSSKDKDIAERLAGDLRLHYHNVWLDSWRIKVGQCIVREIESGIDSADFVVVLLSSHAVESEWVDREWRTAYWDEVNNNSIIILPACIDRCKIPKLLQTKKHATLYTSYDKGLSQLVDAIDHYMTTRLNKEFFYAADGVRAELVHVLENVAMHRHTHWDTFEAAVASLDSTEKREVQRRNTMYYLDRWHLTVFQLKQQFKNLGVYNNELDNVFTDDLIVAITRFQYSHNLRHVDGVFGPLTYLEMEKVIRSKITL